MTPGVTPTIGETPKTATHVASKTRGINSGDDFDQKLPDLIEE